MRSCLWSLPQCARRKQAQVGGSETGAFAALRRTQLGSRNGPELVVDGGFEILTDYGESFSPSWHATNLGLVGVTDYSPQVYEGTYAAHFGVHASPAELTQTIATDVGSTYTFSFALLSEVDEPPSTSNHFEAWLGGQQLLLLDAGDFPFTVHFPLHCHRGHVDYTLCGSARDSGARL
jgi:hypothetical protein